MPDLRNTISHILEHKEHLTYAKEATTQQYVILPILRALGWDDANLASMEVLPEYKVESGSADYALRIKQEQNPVVLIECKRWNEPIARYEEQTCSYAYSGNVPLAIITNGKRWRFYLFRWEASSLGDRFFCETDIENRETAISDLEKYLLKSNVASGEAELNAEIALEEKTRAVTEANRTIARVRDSVPQELRKHYESKYPEKKCSAFYSGVAEMLHLIEEEGWELDRKFSEDLCSFGLKGYREEVVFGLDITFSPPRFFAEIVEEEAEKLGRQHGCKTASDRLNHGRAYYAIPENLRELLPVLEFAYKKYLKSNVASGEAELNAEIALEEASAPVIDLPEPIDFEFTGQELREMRMKAGLTQVQVAEELGLKKTSSSAISDWEYERENVPIKHQVPLLVLYNR